MQRPRSQLLVSVRSAAEATAALAGSADLIDVKEPARGALGRADDATILDIIRTVAGRRLISAAFGELIEQPCDKALPPFFSSVAFIKFGLSNCHSREDWQAALPAACDFAFAGPLVVPVAYADSHLASAPPLDDVVEFACSRAGSVLLLDTWQKSPGQTLLHWLPRPQLAAICRRCHAHNVRVALAGSLGFAEINELLDLQPDWFAVRSAVCRQGRASPVSAIKVRRLARLLHSCRPAAKVVS